MNAKDRKLATNRLSSLGIETPEGPIRRPGIECPFTAMQVVSPCNLSKCGYFIENEWSRNCVLEYVDVQGSESLAPEEIAFLYGSSTEDVKQVIAQGMLQLRENSEETVGFSGDFKRHTPPEIQANADVTEDFTITALTLSPPFMKSVNAALETVAPADIVFRHPAIRILGVLDTIIGELS
jgi:hypothetical protein